MADVKITCQNFTGTYSTINVKRTRDVSRRDILRAVITVGAQKLPDVFSFGWRGLAHRFGMGISAFSFLEEQPAGLCLANEYYDLDMSEKGAATYWYGMALAKIVADVELRVRWLGHVDRMRESGVLRTSSSSNARGDLAGRDICNNWHVIEAKGRSNPCGKTEIAKAKSQAANVLSINGQPPATTSACIASLYTRPISVLLDDPSPEDENNGQRWEIKDDKFFEWYYRPIIEYLRKYNHQRKQTVGNVDFITAPLFPFIRDFYDYPLPHRFYEWRLELGLLAGIYNDPTQAAEVTRNLPHNVDGKVGSDGIAIFGRMPEWEAT